MKLSTKYRMTALALCAISMTLAGNLAAQNPVPFSESFQTYAENQQVAGTNEWYGDTNSIVITNNFTYSGSKPLPSSDPNKIMAINTEGGTITNRFADTGTSDTWIDFMLNPTRVDDYPDLSGSADVDIALFVNSNGHPVIYHLVYDYTTNTYTEIPYITIDSDTWTRVTLRYTTAPFGPNYGLFEIRFDGGSPVTNNEAFLDNGVDYPRGGTLFAEAGTGSGSKPSGLSTLDISGTGFLDDLVVTYTDPLAQSDWYIVAAVRSSLGVNSVDLNNYSATMTPIGISTNTSGSTGTVSIAWSNFWNHTLYVDGTPTNLTNSVEFYETASVTHTVLLVSVAETLTNNVPTWWLATYTTNPNPDNAYALENDDQDGLSNWEEWLASTDPTVSNDFEIIKHYVAGGTGFVEWVSAKVDPQLPPFDVLRTTNLMAPGGGWEIAGSTNRPIGGGTNIWHDPNPPAQGIPVYYRVSATN